jgi:hypothetical protein
VVRGAEINDWEDIASAGGRLYVADIGNNTGARENVDVYWISEPPPARSGEVRVRKHWTLHYPDNPFDAESFFVARGYGYILSKELQGGEAALYRFRLNSRSEAVLEKQSKSNADWMWTRLPRAPTSPQTAGDWR